MGSTIRFGALRYLLSRSPSGADSKPSLHRFFSAKFSSAAEDVDISTEGISRPLSEILRELGKKVPDSFIKTRIEDGHAIKYVPW